MKKLLSFQFRSLSACAGRRDFRRVIGTFVIMFTFSLVTYVQPAFAKVILQEKGTITIPVGETIDDDLFVGGENLSVMGNVTGSIFAGAGTVDISGKVGGDIVAGTGTLTLTKAQVGGNVIVGAGQVSIDDTSKIGGSLIAGVGALKISAPVGRNVMIGAGSAYINGAIGKELRFGGRDLELGPKAKVAGDLTYALGEGQETFKQDSAATVAGSVTRYTPPESATKDLTKAKENMTKFGYVAHGGWLAISFLGSLLLGFLLLKLFPKTSLGLSTQLSSSIMHNLGIGFLIVVAAIPVFLVLALTIIGLPILATLIPAFIIALHLAKLVAAYALGRFVAGQFSWTKMGIYGLFSIGLILFYLLRTVPGIGGLASVLFTWVGLGAIWLYTSSRLKSL